jgi:uncharacterized repeat protein (TIGR01451 family)
MKTTIIRAAALTLVLSLSFAQLDGGWLWNSASADGVSSANQPGVHILNSDTTGITLELYTPDFQVEPLVTEDITCDQLGVTDYATNDQAGWPALPVRGAMLGIPPDADVTLTVLSTDAEILPGRYELCPVPTPIVETGLTGEINFAGYQSLRDAQAYATNVFTPTTSAELVETGFIRSQRVAQVRFHPFQYNPTSGALRHLERIRVRLDFNRAASYPLDAGAIKAIDEGVFEETLSNTLLNYDAARQWRTRPVPLDQIDWPFPAQTEPSYKIMVDEDGIYEVTYADLQAAGIAPATLDALDPRTFQLHNQGQEVAIYVEGEIDGSFDQEDYIHFYGQKMNTRHTDVNVYWLTWAAENGSRMAEIDGTPSGTATVPAYFLTTQHVEEDRSYQSFYTSDPDNDHWLWNGIWAAGAPATNSYTTTLHTPATVPFSATVRGFFRGFAASLSHHVNIYLNGHLIHDGTWVPATPYSFEVTIPQSYLLAGQNTISVTAGVGISTPQDYDYVFVNLFEIDYYAAYTTDANTFSFDGDQAGAWEYRVTGFTTDTLDVFDLTEPISPTRILSASVSGSGVYTLAFQHAISEEHTYLAMAPTQRLTPMQIVRDIPSDLHATSNSADYVVITHGDFYTDVQQLSTYNTITRGLRTIVADVQDVYDEFSYGVFDPTAIQDFLAYAYVNWELPAPSFILLVGDGTFDPKDIYGTGEISFIPPYLADVDPWIGEAPADNRYVCVSGADILPDMHLGRLPAKTGTDASAMIDKIVNYEQNPPGGDWNQRVLFVADNPDSAGDFHDLSDAIADHYLPAPYTAQKVYYGITPYTSGAVTRSAIIAAINEGRLLVNYVGHGATEYWANEQILRTSDIAALANAQKLPLMVPMTCLDGYFVRISTPTRDRSAMGESIVRASGKGAIASWSPTGLGVAAGHDYLNKGLFEALFYDGMVQLGPATLQGKLYLYGNSGSYRDLIDTYLLFGDPALALNVLQTDISITKTVEPPETARAGDAITYTLTYTNTGQATAHNIVITDTLPTALMSPTVVFAGPTITPREDSSFVWDVDDLTPGEGGVITISVTVAPTFGGMLTNTATIATSAVESIVDNNTASTVITVNAHRYYLPIVLYTTGWWTDPEHSRLTVQAIP